MQTLLSRRRARFYRLVHEAHGLPSESLAGRLTDPANRTRYNQLARLACLRVLVCRDFGLEKPSGLPYPQRKKAVRKAMGV